MAPVKISYVVSFSQDPKYPVENLLLEDSLRPWLSCPQDRSRQLRLELQLERASPIGYVDVGNCGCAFLQIEVGRSSWPLNQPYLTLVPSVALMTPADSKLDQNRCRVRTLKEADFLVLAVGQKWDRLRLTCSQPFSKHSQFGLSFIRVRTLLDPEDIQPPPPSQQSLEDPEPADSPWRSSPAFCWTFFPNPCSSSREEKQLKSRLQQLEPAACSPACLSRPAQMVLSAVRSQALRHRASTGAQGGDPELPAEDPGSARDVPAAPTRAHRQPGSRQRPPSPVGRSLPAASGQSTSEGRARAHSRCERQAKRGDSSHDTGICPICSGHFSLDLLAHTSCCGEEDPNPDWPSSLWAEASCNAWVCCPICELPFDVVEVE